ncbi:MAG: cobalt-precorrin-5B (C(1))-methyltransferase, partial [Acidimicrobiales bacterium]
VRRHPLPRLTIGGGFAKLSKLAAGHEDLHSGRSQVDLAWLAEQAAMLGADARFVADVRRAPTALAVLGLSDAAGVPLAASVAGAARNRASALLDGAAVVVDVVVVDRDGAIRAEALGTVPPS